MNINYKKNMHVFIFLIPVFMLYPSILFNFIAPYHQALSLALLLCFFLTKHQPVNLSLGMVLSILLSGTYIVLHAIILDGETIKTSFPALLRVLFIGLIYACYQSSDKKVVINTIVNIVLIILFFNMISFLLVMFFGYESIGGISLHDQRFANFYFLSFSVVDMNFGDFRFLRGGGIFDEPGALGYVSFLTILVNDIYNKGSRKTLWLTLLGFFSFSMAFFVFVLLYTLINLKLKKNIVLYALLLVLVSGVFVSSVPSEKQDIIYAYTIGRVINFSFVGDKPQSSNTRQHINSVAVELIEKKPLWGVGEKYALNYSEYFGTASVFSYVAIYGLLGYLLYISPLVVMFYRIGIGSLIKIKNGCLILLFGLLFYQRPYWDLPLNFLLIFILFEGMNSRMRQKINGRS